MNEEAIKDAYQLFVNNGYTKSIEEFKVLMSENENARKDMFDLFVSEGYKKTPEDFNLLMGVGQVKKKEDSEVTVPGEGTVLRTPQQMEESTSVESLPEERKTLSQSESEDILKFVQSKQKESPVVKRDTVNEVRPISDDGPTLQLTPTTRTTPSEAFLNQSEDPIFQKQEAERIAAEAEQEAERIAAEAEEDSAFQKLESDIQEIKVSPITQEEIELEQSRIESMKTTVPEGYEDQVDLKFLQQNSEDPFERGIAKVEDFFGQTEAKAVADLNKAFDQYGFRFEEALGLTGAVKVVAANGKEITLMQRGKDKYKELEEFLNNNRVESTIIQNRINTAIGKDTKKEIRALSEEELEEENNRYSMQFSDYQESVKEYKKRLKQLESFTPKTEQDLYIYNTEVAKINEMSKALNKGRDNLIAAEGDLQKMASDYAYYESQKWDVPSLITQTLAKGFLGIGKGAGDFLITALDAADMSWLYGYNDEGLNDFYKDLKDRLIRGTEAATKDLQSLGTTEESIEKIKKDSFFAGALIGTLESVPAMATGVGGLFLHAYSGADDSIRQYEGHEDLSEFEKTSLKVLLSTASAVLEKAGLDNAMGKTGLLNRFIFKALGGVPKDASALTIKRTLERKAVDFVKGLGSASVGEGITGGSQEIADITIKELYNQAKGIDVFKTPKSVREFVEQVSEAAAAEAIGGFVLGGAGAVANAVSNEKVLALPDGVVEMFEMMSQSDKFDPLFAKSLKVQLSKGVITKEEAQTQLDNYNEAKSLIKQIPEDYTTPQKKMAFSLLGIKKRLEKEIEGKDPDLTKELQEQLENVKEKLSTVKQDVTNMQEGVEISEPNQTYFFDFKSKKEIPEKLRGLEPVVETKTKKSRLGKTENIRIGFKGSQLIDTGFAKKAEPKTETVAESEVKPTQKTTEVESEVQEEIEKIRQEELAILDAKQAESERTGEIPTDENGNAINIKEEKQKINSKYDAELAALESTPQTTEVEAEKAETTAEVEAEVQEEIEEEIEEEVEEKRPPSAKKIIGAPKRKKVTVDEYAALKDQIRLEAKAARTAKKDLNQRRKELAEKIKEFEKGKNITTAKSQAITNKISKVNLDNDAAVEKLLDYIAEQYEVAKVKEEVSLSNKKREKAIRNIKSKIGTAKNTFGTFKTLFSYDARLITDKALKAKYEALLERFGSSSAVLSVKELDSEAKLAQEIINEIEEEYSTFEELSDIFYENQVLDKEGNIDYKATINELSKGSNPILVNDQIKVLEKYKRKLELKEKKEALTPEEQKAVTNGLIDEVMKIEAKNNVTDNEASKKSAANLIRLLSNRKNLEGLTDNQIKSIPAILENLKNGIFTSRANTVMNALDAKENSDAVTKKLNKAKAMAIESVVRGLQSTLTKKTSAYNQIVSNPLKDIDTILGIEGTEVYDRTFKRMGSAFAAFQEATREINERLTEVNTKLTKAFKANENKITEAKFRMMAYMLQLEYESNPELQGKKGSVFKADEWIDATIAELSGKNQEATIKILREVRKQVKGKSANDILEGMTKVEKEAIKVVKDINKETAEKALYVGAIVRGSRPNMINEYTHHDVISTSDLSKKEVEDYLTEMNNVKTKAGTIESRSAGVKPLNMDILNSTMKGAKQTLLDFHVTNENRVVKKTLNEVVKNVSPESERKRKSAILKAAEVSPQEFAVAMEEAYDTAMRVAFGNSYRSASVLDKMVGFGYQAQLASIPRAGAEFVSNLGYVVISSPKIFSEGVRLFKEIGLNESIEYMKLSGSSELSKFTGAKNTGKSIDMLAKNPDLSKAEGLNALANLVKSAKNTQAGALTSKAAETAADILISTPDKVVSMPLWLGTFARSMKAKGLDLNKFKSDKNYRAENAKAIEEARNEADQELNKAAGSQNAFAGVLKNKIDKTKDSATKQAYKYVNGYLTNFLIFEYSTARKGIIQLTKEGKINKLEGLSLLAATTARMASYSMLYKMFSSLFFAAFGAEDEQEDELEANDVTRALVGSTASLLLGRNFGTIARKGLNFGTEFLNKEYGQVLRGDEEYNAFEHGLGLSFFNPNEEDMKRKRLEKKLIREISGPLSNHVGLLLDMSYSAYDYLNARNEQEKSKAADFLINQAMFETFGLFTGKIPLFKDLKKALYQIPTNNEFAIKERQISFKDMKAQNPDKYADIENQFEENSRVKEIDTRLKKLKIRIDSGNISKEKLKQAKYEQSTLEKEKKEIKRVFFDENFGLMDKDKIGKVSESNPENEKTLEQELAEIEVVEEKTYSEYEEMDKRQYKRVLNSVKKNRNYAINSKEMKRLKLLLKKTRDAKRKEKIESKISKLENENSKIKRDIFNKMFKI